MSTTVTTAAASNAVSDIVSTTPATSAKNQADAADRFLKLLVAQMQNQDPLKPMDNAEVTSQMAQIQTVSGIEKVNSSIQSMLSQFSAMQSVQGASLVGRDVMIEGNTLVQDGSGKAFGGFSIDGTADQVRVDIISTSGAVIDTMNLGAQPAGQHSFGWTIPSDRDPTQVATFRITATAGTTAVASTPLAHDRVNSVITGGPSLMLELQGAGNVSYDQIKSFN